MKKEYTKTIRLSILIFFVFFVILDTLTLTYALSDFEFICESPVTVVRELDGEIKYKCEVTNKGSSNLELRYEVDARNPIDPMIEANFHPQPANIYLEPGETRAILAFESIPDTGNKEELTYSREIFVVPPGETRSSPNSKSAVIKTIIDNRKLEYNMKIEGNIYDDKTKDYVKDAVVTLKYDAFSRKDSAREGSFSLNVPKLDYFLNIKADGYELYSSEVKGSDEFTSIDIYLDRAKEKGEYGLVKEFHVEAGAWEGIWRSAISKNEKYIAFGTGGNNMPGNGEDAFLYLFDIDGNQLWKKNMETEVRGIDVSNEGDVAVSLGYGQGFDKARLYDKQGKLVWEIFDDSDSYQEIIISNTEKYIAVGNTLKGEVYLLNYNDGSEIWKRPVEGQARAIEFYEDDSHVLVGSGSNYVYLFNIKADLRWKAYVHSWPYAFIATSKGNGYLATGGHMSYLHIIDNNGKDKWVYGTYGGFRWADISEKGIVAGTRSELAFLDNIGTVIWKDHDSMSGMISADDKYILTGDQRAHVELRNLKGTILWEYPKNPSMEYGRDVRFTYMTKDNSKIITATKRGEVYFFEGSISEISYPEEIKQNVPKENDFSNDLGVDDYFEEKGDGPKQDQEEEYIEEIEDARVKEKKNIFERIIDFFRRLFA